MSLDADVGAGFELGPFSLKTLVAIQAGLETLAQRLEDIRRVQESYQFGPVEAPIRASAFSDSAGDTLVLDMGGPSYERKWQVRRISVGGQTWTTSVNGKALVVVSSARNSNPATTDVADYASSLPLPAFYSTGQLIVRHPNRLFVVILSPSASTQYVAGGSVEDLPDKREPIVSAN